MKRQTLLITLTCSTALAGPLVPPAGPIAPTPGPEPRIAINATNTPGDSNSLFKITQPGSYYLTANVTGVAGKHGIEIVSSGVTIDLMGFDLVGVPGMGAFDGVSVSVSSLTAIAVRNGSVRNWGHTGIDLAAFSPTNSVVSEVRATGNAGDGIAVGQNSQIITCVASKNGGDGLQLSSGSGATGCTASGNALYGIRATVANTITNCAANQNTTGGINAEIGSRVTDCVARENGDDGFVIGSMGSISGCVASANGGSGFRLNAGASITNCSSQSNTLHGIRADSRCHIVGNNCVRNAPFASPGSGIYVNGNTSRIEGNVCTENDRGIEIDGEENLVVRNTCRGNSIANWDIAANNVCGPILNRSAPASAAILGDSAPSSLGTTDANANFSL